MEARVPWTGWADAGPAPGTAVQVSRVLPVGREEAFRAWTEPELLRRWFTPPGGSSPSAELDVRPGGRYRIAMQRPPEAAVTHYQVGTYLEVEPPERLVFTFGWQGLPPLDVLEGLNELDSRVTVTFRDVDGSTEVSVTHERLGTENLRAFHRWGWTSALEKLESMLSSATHTTEGGFDDERSSE